MFVQGQVFYNFSYMTSKLRNSCIFWIWVTFLLDRCVAWENIMTLDLRSQGNENCQLFFRFSGDSRFFTIYYIPHVVLSKLIWEVKSFASHTHCQNSSISWIQVIFFFNRRCKNSIWNFWSRFSAETINCKVDLTENNVADGIPFFHISGLAR